MATPSSIRISARLKRLSTAGIAGYMGDRRHPIPMSEDLRMMVARAYIATISAMPSALRTPSRESDIADEMKMVGINVKDTGAKGELLQWCRGAFAAVDRLAAEHRAILPSFA